MVYSLCTTMVQMAEKMVFSLEVKVRFINRKGSVNNKDIDHVMVIIIQMTSSFFTICISKHASL